MDLPEDVVKDTIIHEMIHYYIMSNQMQDTAPHGKLFIAKMQEINRKFNRNLAVTHRTTKGSRIVTREFSRTSYVYHA